MVDDVKDIIETAESKASQEVLDRARLARERREAEQRKRLDELRAHAAAAQAQREKRDEDRRRRQAEQRAKDDDRRVQVEERKRAIWEASISRREALLQRERDRSERLERQRAARSAPRPAFAFGSSTPRLLEPLDSAGFFWAARSTNPIDQVNFFESLAASTTNVMFASAPLTRRASALQLDLSDTDNKDEPDRQLPPVMWSSVARRRTDLVPTVPAPRAPGRAYSMTRLDRLPPSPATHLSRTQTRSGETTPGSRPGSALSNATGVVRRPNSAPRKPRPASIAGTGVNTPRDLMSQSVASTPSVSRDSTALIDAPRRPPSAHTPRRPRPASLYANAKPATPVAPGEGKPPVHRKPKPSKEHEKSARGKSLSASPGRALSPSPRASKEPSIDKDVHMKVIQPASVESMSSSLTSHVSAEEVTHKLEALQIQNSHENTLTEKETIEIQESTQSNEMKIEAPESKPEAKPIETQKELKPETQKEQKPEVQKEHKPETQKEHKPEVQKENKPEVQKETPQKEQKLEMQKPEKKEPSQEKTDDSEMTASMIGRKITTEEEAKAALAERRRRAREELERQAELERQRLQREAEEEMERQRIEEERQRREEEEARELARLQRSMEEEKLRKAIEAQQQLEREEAERKTREEADRQAKLREEEEKRRAAEEAEKLRREEAEREEKERIARKQRVEAIMARTRLRKAEEDKKQQDNKPSQAPAAAPTTDEVAPTPFVQADNGTAPVNNGSSVVDNGSAPVNNGSSVVDNGSSVVDSGSAPVDNGTTVAPVDNGNVATEDLLGFSTSQVEVSQVPSPAAGAVISGEAPPNGNHAADPTAPTLLHNTEEKIVEQPTKPIDSPETNTNTNNGNGDGPHIQPPSANLTANFIQNEITANEAQSKLLDDDFTTHNGHGHPLTLQNAI